eukprot:105532_1
MANQSAEGTEYNGENKLDDSEDTEFYKWMIANSAKPKLIKALVENEYDTIDILRELQGKDNEIDEVANACGLKHAQKLNLKAVIKRIPLNTFHNVIDKEEREAILTIDEKLKLISQSLERLKNTKNIIDEHVTNGRQFIEKSFDNINQALNSRKTFLIEQLNKMANNEKHELDKQHKILHKHLQDTQQKSSECHKSLRKALQLQQIDNRKKNILSAAKSVKNIKIVQNNDPLLTNYKNMTINCDSTKLLKAINNFSVISRRLIPILISVKDNKNSSVVVTWKLDKNNDNLDNNKIKIEWNEVELKMNDDNKEDYDCKIEWNNNKIFDINNNDKN